MARLQWIILCGGFFVLPLLVNPFSYDPFELDKITFVRLMGLLAWSAIFFVGLFRAAPWLRSHNARDPGFWLFIFIAWSFIASLLSFTPVKSMMGSMLRGGGALTLLTMCGLYIFFRAYPLTRSMKQVVTKGSVVLTGVLSLLAFFQYAVGTYIYVPITLITTGAPFQLLRPASTFGHPLYFGIFLVILAPFLWYAWMTTQSRMWRAMIFISSVMGVGALYLTRGRIAFLALAVLGAVYVWIKISKKMRVVMCVGGIIVAVVLFSAPAVQKTVLRTPSLVVRYEEWKYGVELILRRPFFGYGHETYDAYSVVRERAPHELDDGISDRLHNIWLDTAWNTGIIGLVLYGMMWVILCMSFLRKREFGNDIVPDPHRQGDDTWYRTVIASLLVYLITMQTSFDFSYTYFLLPLLLAQVSVIPTHHAIPTKVGIQSRNAYRIVAFMGMIFGFVYLIIGSSIAGMMLYNAGRYIEMGRYDLEARIYHTAQKFSPFLGELYWQEYEALYAHSKILGEDAPPELLARIERARHLARVMGFPWYRME